MLHIGEKNALHTPAILIVPACEQGRGGGHLSRSLLLLRSLRIKGRDAYLWIPPHLKDDFLHRFSEFIKSTDHPCFLSHDKELKNFTWDFIVLDCFQTSGEEFKFWAGIAPIIGIDEGGPFRKRFDFLLDLLPSLSKHEPNLSAPSLLPLPKNRRPPASNNSTGSLRILISFGAEDPVGIGTATARVLSRLAVKAHEVTLIAPSPPDDSIAGIKVISKVPHLQEHFTGYDLLITHFGLAAFEAVYARLPVMLISPTVYHEKLSRYAGFFSLGLGAHRAGRLEKFSLDRKFLEILKKRGEEIAGRFDLEKDQKEDLSSFVHNIVVHSRRYCPVCEKKAGIPPPVILRSQEESYRRCPFCKTIYLSRLNAPPIEYERDYFFDLYKKQYGKTYLEDFPNLVEMGRKRMANINGLLENHLPIDKKHGRAQGAKSLLDIGCAYGPFLTAAAESGFSPMGLDPAEDAIRYVKDELGFPAWQGFFPSGELRDGQFDVVTLWYVIEHFEEPGKMMAEINRLLKKGGVLAFSTPSYSGISGSKNLRSFLLSSPPDHYTVWSLRSCRRIFKQYGFRLKKTVVTGHHPERFPFIGRFLDPAKKCWLYRLLLLVSRLFRLGDTFDAYGVKE